MPRKIKTPKKLYVILDEDGVWESSYRKSDAIRLAKDFHSGNFEIKGYTLIPEKKRDKR